MNEILLVFLAISLIFSAVLFGLLVADRLNRMQILDQVKKTYDELKDIANKLQNVHNDNILKMIEMQDKVNAIEYRVKGK